MWQLSKQEILRQLIWFQMHISLVAFAGNQLTTNRNKLTSASIVVKPSTARLILPRTGNRNARPGAEHVVIATNSIIWPNFAIQPKHHLWRLLIQEQQILTLLILTVSGQLTSSLLRLAQMLLTANSLSLHLIFPLSLTT